MIDGSVDPTACSGVAPRARIAGVDTTAPPTPNVPESTPVASPAANVSSVRHGSDTVRRVTRPRPRGRFDSAAESGKLPLRAHQEHQERRTDGGAPAP